MAKKISTGDFVVWTTQKGKYTGRVSSTTTSGRHQVAIYEGTETVEATIQKPVASIKVLINNEDGTFSTSDRTVKVQFAMLQIVKEPEMKAVSASVKKTLQQKVADHNDSVGDAASKRTNLRALTAVFERGIGAYQNNPGSVRPTVTSAEQWAFARVNSFLYALRNGRFRGGKHDTDLLPKGHPQSTKSTETKGPKCRQADETLSECVSRKISELIDEEGYDRDQAVAIANNMCETSCEEQKQIVNKRTNFPKRGDDQKVSIANSQWKTFPRGEAEKLRTEWPQIWRRGGNVLGNTQYRRLTKVMEQGGTPKSPTDEKAVRLREAWVARHFKDFRLAGVVAQIKWLAVGSRGLPFMRKVISDEKKRLRDREKSLDEEE